MSLSLFAPPFAVAVHYRCAIDRQFSNLRPALGFTQATTTMYGKTFPVPRLESWFGLNPYRYGGQLQQPKPWPDALHRICDEVEAIVGESFDSCFANLYRDGKDCIGWHADDDDWIGPWIASVSFGEARRFVMRRKHDKTAKQEFTLRDGDLLVMPPGTQQEWEHSVLRDRSVTPRINLTFRQTIGPHPLHKGPKGRGVAP